VTTEWTYMNGMRNKFIRLTKLIDSWHNLENKTVSHLTIKVVILCDAAISKDDSLWSYSCIKSIHVSKSGYLVN